MTAEQSSHDAMTTSELQDEIDRTREQLGETVDALAAKLDVKTRVKENPRPAFISIAVVGVCVGAVIWWRSAR
ncbi:MAG: hypothetical protein JWP10_17 [Nocardioidaceae bacterium]|nr:hypothetical protein [Nocardioidaceae bacterium]